MRRYINALGTKLGDKGINIAALNFRRHAAQGEFAEELVEVIDHGAGTVISFDGQRTEWVRREDGEWVERPSR